MRSHTSGNRPHAPRRAFSLLEVVVAMSLSVVLLGALLTALDLQRRLWTTGRAEIEQARLQRAILERIARDIRSVAYEIAAEEEEEVATGTFGATSEEELDSSSTEDSTEDSEEEEASAEDVVVAADEALTSGAAMLAGDSANLVLQINRPSRPSPMMLLAAASGDPNLLAAATIRDQRSVAYFLSQNSAGNLQAAAASYLSSVQGSPAVGLVRLEGNSQAMQYADALGDIDSLAAHARTLAPEVAYLQFRYFDGLSWYDAWDSSTMGTLPAAVEITVGLAQQSAEIEPNDIAATTTSLTGLNVAQMVVYLPTSVPASTTTTTTTY